MIGTKVLEERQSKINGQLKVVKTIGLGTYIQAEGLTQSGGIVETIWKQTIKKVKRNNPGIKSCLILGLGGGTVAGVIKKNYKGVKITGIDLDPVIVSLGKKYLGLKGSEVDIIIGDAGSMRKYIKTDKKFDLIIVDLYKGDNYPDKFGTTEFFNLVKKYVSVNGLVIFNRLYYKNKKIEAEEFGLRLKKDFGVVDSFYPDVNVMFLCSI